MRVSAFSRRVVGIIGFGVALPAVLLATLGVFLTLRISQAIESQSRRYNLYIAQQVAQSFEQELMGHLRASITVAETVARTDGDRTALMNALATGTGEFDEAHFVPLSELTDYLLLVVESQPLVYGAPQGDRSGRTFAGLMLRDADGQVIGAGGWWFSPRVFLIGHLRTVMEQDLASNPRIYGGIESTRHLAVELLGSNGQEISRIRQPGDPRTAAIEPLAGPFEGFAIRVRATPNAPVAWTNRFVL